MKEAVSVVGLVHSMRLSGGDLSHKTCVIVCSVGHFKGFNCQVNFRAGSYC